MGEKLKCVLVDDDPLIHAIVEDMFRDSQHAKLVAQYTCPKEFMDSLGDIQFDFCLLDIMMPVMDGLTIARMLKDKPVVFITSVYEKIPQALDISPIDVILKPILKARFEKVMRKTCYIIRGEKESKGLDDKKTQELFWVAEMRSKVKITLADIVFVHTDDIDYRNKVIYLQDGKKLTVMDYSFGELMKLAPQLMQVNKSELISVEVFGNIRNHIITLNRPVEENCEPRKVFLGRAFRKSVHERIAYA